MKIILADFGLHSEFLPFTYTKPLAELRMGILTFRERWEKAIGEKCESWGPEYLKGKYPCAPDAENLVLRATLLPTPALLDKVKGLNPGEALYQEDQLLAYRGEWVDKTDSLKLAKGDFAEELLWVQKPWDLFSKNGAAIAYDFELLTAGRSSKPLSSTNTVLGDSNLIFLEEGAEVECSILNTSNGPIYIGSEAKIMEGSIVRGGLALCEGAQLKMGSKIYGPATFGPYCKVGGEVNNAILMGYSNKGHEGFLGNSVLGEWCNLGADTNTSNLKNNYAPVRLWDYASGRFAHTGLQFCGLMMGDHSKAGINTMFNTGTVVGVSANIFGSGFPRNFIPSFSWGGASGYTEYKTNKAFETAEAMMARRGVEFDENERAILETVFEMTAPYRTK